MRRFFALTFIYASLVSCKHLNFLYKCSESSIDQIGDHKIKCKESLK